MSSKKAAAFLIGGVVILGFVGAANAASKRKQASPIGDGTEEPDDLEEDETEVQVTTPEGETDPFVVTDEEDELEDLEDTDPVTKPEKTQTDALETLADGGSVTEQEVINDIVKESLPEGTKVAPLAEAETDPEVDPHGTVSLARMMLARERFPKWKQDMKPQVKEWQQATGDLEDDGEFGPESVARMAEEVGLLPLVRTWPRSARSKAEALDGYRALIGGVISRLPSDPDSAAHRLALEASMDREKAVTFGSKNPPEQKTLQWADKVLTEIATQAQEQGAADIQDEAS